MRSFAGYKKADAASLSRRHLYSFYNMVDELILIIASATAYVKYLLKFVEDILTGSSNSLKILDNYGSKKNNRIRS